MIVRVKICGINDAPGCDAACDAGAAMLGFVFHAPSPRAVTPVQAGVLARRAAGGPRLVGLFVDPEDATIAAVLAAVPLDLIQLHGAEPPRRCATIAARFGVGVMKAVGVATADDLAAADPYGEACAELLLDAKPPPGAALPGGNAAAFDWTILAGARLPLPWLLAGGLTPETVAEAIRISGATGVDVSSGVERSRGVKDPARIRAFIAAARGG